MAISPAVAGAGAASGLIATLTSRVLNYPAPLWRNGMYGYSGVLVGIFWGALFPLEPVSGVMLIAAAVLSAPLTRLTHRYFTPREIPALALPSLCLTWMAGIILEPALFEPALFEPIPSAATHFLGYGLLAAGLILYSRLLALSALLGAVIGLGLSGFLAGQVSSGIALNSISTAVALGAVFFPWSFPSLLIASFGSAAAGLLWWGVDIYGASWGIHALVGPFNLVTILILVAIRIPTVRRWVPGRPVPLPLHGLGQPEERKEAWLARCQLRKLVRRSRRIFVLTGAGVSTGAGLPDFKTPSDLWLGQKRISLDDFFRSPEARETYWEQEEKFFRLARCATPSIAHQALASLYRRGRLSVVVTQNVDGLHQSAGLPAEATIELHGNIYETRCMDCGRTVPRENLSARINTGGAGTYCESCRGILKGGSLMFGEKVASQYFEKAIQKLLSSDLLLVLGTSLEVTPASDFLKWARDAGMPIAIVNTTPTKMDELADVTVADDVGDILLDLLEETGHKFP